MSRWDALRRDAERIRAAAMRAADPAPRVRDALRELPDGGGALRVLGAGKAAANMAAAAEAALGDRLDGGIVVVPEGHEVPLQRVEVRIGAHPVPDARSVAAGGALLAAARAAAPGDRFVGLWSGGASALVEVPQPGWTLEAIARETDRRLRAGDDIATINAARRTWSALKGGQLCRAGPGTWLNLVLFDVPGDDPALVGSGPAIGAGTRDVAVGSSADALAGAEGEAFALRYAVLVLDAELRGEARDAGERLARAVSALPAPHPPMALLLAGEPVVSGVPAGARGGRMQELALAAALALDGADAVVLALATDGRDGNSDATGALVDGGTAERARAAGVDPAAALAAHASNGALAASGDLRWSGPTGPNVRDLVVALIPAS
ncbi:MAG: DUF4147 domain-containing protein [Myxococcota bacterium]